MTNRKPEKTGERNGNMKTNDTAIITALMVSRTNAEAAGRLQMSESQLYERMKDRAFKQLLLETQGQLLARTSDMMLSKAAEAVETIAEIMSDRENPASVRLSAANTILKQTTAIKAFQWAAEEQDKDKALDIAFGMD